LLGTIFFIPEKKWSEKGNKPGQKKKENKTRHKIAHHILELYAGMHT